MPMPMKLAIREIDHVVLRVKDMLGAEFVAFRPDFNMTRLRAGRSHPDPEGNQVELKGPSDGKGPPS